MRACEDVVKAKSDGSKHLRNMAILLVMLLIAALAFYRYLRTESARVFLLDAGLSSRYEIVQRDVGKRITKALRAYGVPSDRVKSEKAEASGRERAVVVIHAEAPPDASLIQINSAVKKAAGEIGARVRSCREGKDGRSITMEIGTRRVLTHRCVIKKGSEREVQVERYLGAPVVALCVDDFGFFYNALVKDFLALEVPLTISIIPGLKHSQRIAIEAEKAGKDAICHLPMEAEKEGWDSGEIPLIRGAMSAREIEKATEKALETVPGVIGMNNHMGSKATADRKVVEAVLRVCRAHSLYFFDSVTTPRTVVHEVAGELHVPTASNDLFVDGGDGETRENMQKLLSIAARRGSAIGIVHARAQTLRDVRWMIDEAEKEGIRFITISEMINRRSLKISEGGP